LAAPDGCARRREGPRPISVTNSRRFNQSNCIRPASQGRRIAGYRISEDQSAGIAGMLHRNRSADSGPLWVIFDPRGRSDTSLFVRFAPKATVDDHPYFSPLTHRGGRVIGTDTVGISLVLHVSSDDQECEQGGQDNPIRAAIRSPRRRGRAGCVFELVTSSNSCLAARRIGRLGPPKDSTPDHFAKNRLHV
jgi:hypothetical protein